MGLAFSPSSWAGGLVRQQHHLAVQMQMPSRQHRTASAPTPMSAHCHQVMSSHHCSSNSSAHTGSGSVSSTSKAPVLTCTAGLPAASAACTRNSYEPGGTAMKRSDPAAHGIHCPRYTHVYFEAGASDATVRTAPSSLPTPSMYRASSSCASSRLMPSCSGADTLRSVARPFSRLRSMQSLSTGVKAVPGSMPTKSTWNAAGCLPAIREVKDTVGLTTSTTITSACGTRVCRGYRRSTALGGERIERSCG
mmetsp:Transcript_24557/g.61706  ORF Transcript_24557/g.61706 Transcript_24557/m.61706 type:complete len:250 (-) Transcript_24557:358-1107(-)